MANAKRDDNQVPVRLAFDGTTTQPIRVDPVTSRLEIDITGTSSISPPTLKTTITRDDNFVPVGAGITDDGNSVITPFIINNSNGLLWIDVVFE